MSSTQTWTNPALLEEMEFDRACENQGCDEPAAVMIRLSHSIQGCPGPPTLHCRGHYSQKRKEMRDFLWAAELSPAPRCERCRRKPTGVCNDNMIVIWLR